MSNNMSSLAFVQEQQEVIKKLQQYATAAATGQAGSQESSRGAEEPLPPLECSQRAVIRSLTAQLADLRRQLVQLSTGKFAGTMFCVPCRSSQATGKDRKARSSAVLSGGAEFVSGIQTKLVKSQEPL